MQWKLLNYGREKMKKILFGAALAIGTFVSSVSTSFADELLVPQLTYRVGPFAANGTMGAKISASRTSSSR